jgi:hypothetical protein
MAQNTGRWMVTMTTRRTVLMAALSLLLMPGAAAAQSESVRLLGEVRARGEAERPAAYDTVDALTLLRSRIGIEATLSPKAVVMLQLQDARTFGEEASTADGAADRLDMHQAWLQYRLDAGGLGVSIRAGRQEVILGTERLVGAVGWSNTGRSFDGARVTVGPEKGWKLHALAATVAERGRRFTGVQPERSDHLLAGGYLETDPADVFALFDREDAYRTYTGVDRITVGTRIGRQFGQLTPSLEAAYQLGNQVLTTADLSQDISAYMIGARLGLDTKLAVLPRLGAGVDWLSGDDDPTDDTHRAFNTMYATNHKYYGFMDLFLDPAARTRDRGLIDGIASARIGLGRDLALDIDAHGFWLQQAFAASTERNIGYEIDLTLPIRLGTGQQLHVGYSAFRNGAAAPLLGFGSKGDLWHWAYVQATFSFGGRAAPIL